MPEKIKTFFFHITIKYTFTLTSAGTLLGPRYFVIFVLWFLSDLQGTQSAMRMCWPGHYFCQFDKFKPVQKNSNQRLNLNHNIYTVYLENWWRKVTYIWKVELSQHWTFVIIQNLRKGHFTLDAFLRISTTAYNIKNRFCFCSLRQHSK